ncbi:nucleotidyltransferase substrate binding protein [Dyadobacter sp. CY323]|uniref:nucleotidyltransferase substrate binding protein n=1 Tax=Dyadobacter sp. CY323 TaxID=2907302 RepID=UPI001F2C333C|nr:nucleotidyltransferase substrate binding protein [Dyadobacter sp. CY323]MCE6991428.1 nucleotidyltransferase substrate binding protein [Dyadobacter sp. CY323]
MNEQDIRWEQRFNNYLKALHKLDQAVSKIKKDYPSDEAGNIDEDDFLDDIIKEGLIQRFEYTHELAWNVMKDFLLHEGDIKVLGSKDATRAAFAADLIEDGELWMEMVKSRNQTSHTYNEGTADAIFERILEEYLPAFLAFKSTMEEKRYGEHGNIFEKE